LILKTNPKTQVSTRFAISYSRVSTEIQSGEYKTGLARQDDGFRSFLDQYPNYKAWNQKFEDIGKSAFQAYKNRSALTAIIESAENGDFGNDPCLVISEVSRLTREPQKEANKLLNRIFDAGLSIYVSELGGQIYTEKDQTVYLLFQILFLAAHSESREKSHRINGYHNEKIQRFKKGDFSVHFRERKHPSQKCFYPFWLDFSEQTKTFSFNKRAEWAKQICDLSLEMGATEISKRLQKQGIKSLTNRRKPLSVHFIADILKNPALIGYFQPMQTTTTESGGMLVKNREEAIEGVFPSLITPEQFEKIQATRTKRSRNKSAPRPRERKRWLFGNSTFCRECGEKISFLSVPKPKLSDPNNHYYYLHCSAGYNRAEEICTCRKRFNAKKDGVDFELDILKRLQTFRWASYFNDEKYEKSLKAATAKSMRLLNKRNEYKREVNRLRENLDELLTAEDILPEVISRIGVLQKRAIEKYETVNDDFNSARNEESTLKSKKRGKEIEKDIRQRVDNFIKTGRFDLQQRQEFSRWFFETGLVVDIDLYTGRFEIGIGRREKGVLVEVDMRLEDIAAFKNDGATFVDENGNPLDMDHFIQHYKEVRAGEEKRRLEMEASKKKPLRDQLIRDVKAA